MVIFQNFKAQFLRTVHTLFGSFFPTFTLLLLSFQGTLFTTLEMEELPSMKINGQNMWSWQNGQMYTPSIFTCKSPSLMYTPPQSTTSPYSEPHPRQCASINSKS